LERGYEKEEPEEFKMPVMWFSVLQVHSMDDTETNAIWKADSG
jgi:hypothetical protein